MFPISGGFVASILDIVMPASVDGLSFVRTRTSPKCSPENMAGVTFLCNQLTITILSNKSHEYAVPVLCVTGWDYGRKAADDLKLK